MINKKQETKISYMAEVPLIIRSGRKSRIYFPKLKVLSFNIHNFFQRQFQCLS